MENGGGDAEGRGSLQPNGKRGGQKHDADRCSTSTALPLPPRISMCGGLLFDRHKPPLKRRFVVHYCSALYRRVGRASIRLANPGTFVSTNR